jgi:hypothetical protein
LIFIVTSLIAIILLRPPMCMHREDPRQYDWFKVTLFVCLGLILTAAITQFF